MCVGLKRRQVHSPDQGLVLMFDHQNTSRPRILILVQLPAEVEQSLFMPAFPVSEGKKGTVKEKERTSNGFS